MCNDFIVYHRFIFHKDRLCFPNINSCFYKWIWIKCLVAILMKDIDFTDIVKSSHLDANVDNLLQSSEF